MARARDGQSVARLRRWCPGHGRLLKQRRHGADHRSRRYRVISFRALLWCSDSNIVYATAWLVSFKLTGIDLFVLVLGVVVSAVPTRLRVIGKAVFYSA